MFQPKRTLLLALTFGTMLMATSCADDSLSKGLVVAGGAAGGAFLGSKVAPGNPLMGGVVGAGLGGALGLLLGSQIGQKK